MAGGFRKNVIWVDRIDRTYFSFAAHRPIEIGFIAHDDGLCKYCLSRREEVSKRKVVRGKSVSRGPAAFFLSLGAFWVLRLVDFIGKDWILCFQVNFYKINACIFDISTIPYQFKVYQL